MVLNEELDTCGLRPRRKGSCLSFDILKVSGKLVDFFSPHKFRLVSSVYFRFCCKSGNMIFTTQYTMFTYAYWADKTHSLSHLYPKIEKELMGFRWTWQKTKCVPIFSIRLGNYRFIFFFKIARSDLSSVL